MTIRIFYILLLGLLSASCVKNNTALPLLIEKQTITLSSLSRAKSHHPVKKIPAGTKSINFNVRMQPHASSLNAPITTIQLMDKKGRTTLASIKINDEICRGDYGIVVSHDPLKYHTEHIDFTTRVPWNENITVSIMLNHKVDKFYHYSVNVNSEHHTFTTFQMIDSIHFRVSQGTALIEDINYSSRTAEPKQGEQS